MTVARPSGICPKGHLGQPRAVCRCRWALSVVGCRRHPGSGQSSEGDGRHCGPLPEASSLCHLHWLGSVTAKIRLAFRMPGRVLDECALFTEPARSHGSWPPCKETSGIAWLFPLENMCLDFLLVRWQNLRKLRSFGFVFFIPLNAF